MGAETNWPNLLDLLARLYIFRILYFVFRICCTLFTLTEQGWHLLLPSVFTVTLMRV